MKEILLNKGYKALIDDEDFNQVNKFKWSIAIRKRNFYAQRSYIKNGKPSIMLLHRYILNPCNNIQIDHIDHNGLNCQRSNLRLATNAQNSYNQRKRNSLYSYSKFKGVSWNKRAHKWISQIQFMGKNKYLGLFNDEILAWHAYNEAAERYFGNFSYFDYK